MNVCVCVFCCFLSTMACRNAAQQWRQRASAVFAGAQHAVCRCCGALAAGGLWLLLGGAATAVHAARRHCCCAAAERPALCAAGTLALFAAAGDVHAGVCAATALLLHWIRKQC